jgi:hypothetical protein
MDIGPSEAETFWTPFLPKLVRRGLRGIKLVVRDAHAGVKGTVRKGRQHRLAAFAASTSCATHVGACRREQTARGRRLHSHRVRPGRCRDHNSPVVQVADQFRPQAAQACPNLGIRHVRTRAYPPKINGKAERTNRTPEGHDRQRLFARSQTFMPNDSRPLGQTRRVPPPTPFAKISSAHGH